MPEPSPHFLHAEFRDNWPNCNLATLWAAIRPWELGLPDGAVWLSCDAEATGPSVRIPSALHQGSGLSRANLEQELPHEFHREESGTLLFCTLLCASSADAESIAGRTALSGDNLRDLPRSFYLAMKIMDQHLLNFVSDTPERLQMIRKRLVAHGAFEVGETMTLASAIAELGS